MMKRIDFHTESHQNHHGNIFCVTGPLCREFTGHWWIALTKASDKQLNDIFFDLHQNKRLSKQSRRQWLEMPSLSLWHHCNDIMISSHMQDIALVFWCIIDTAVINKVSKIHDNIPPVKWTIAAQVEHKCTGKLKSFITAVGGHWRCSCLWPVCPRALIFLNLSPYPYITRTSVAMVLSILDDNSLSSRRKDVLYLQLSFFRNDRKCRYHVYFHVS